MRSFPERLTQARRLLAQERPPLPLHLVDQMEAASMDALRLQQRTAAVLRAVDPDRGWRQAIAALDDEQEATILAAIMGCRPCRHLRKGGPQPAVARLPLEQLDCHACIHHWRRPPAGDDDRCDICGSHGNATFWPFSATRGLVTVAGDACKRCAVLFGMERAAWWRQNAPPPVVLPIESALRPTAGSGPRRPQ
jgi:hypothetical protein